MMKEIEFYLVDVVVFSGEIVIKDLVVFVIVL